MGILGIGTETYLYVNGISCLHEIELSEGIVLMPADLNTKIEKILNLLKSDVDFAIAILSFKTLSAQLKIMASDSQQLAIKAWNSQWDCILLGAIFDCDVMSNLQCDKDVRDIEKASYINVTNYHLSALLKVGYCLSKDDEDWIKKFYKNASTLMNSTEYRSAVHAMATYRWHSMPYVQLAILWSGIEALFNIKKSISSQIGFCIAKFLSKNNINKYSKKIKKLYRMRSLAVHGNNIENNKKIQAAINKSASLLNEIIKYCAEHAMLPMLRTN